MNPPSPEANESPSASTKPSHEMVAPPHERRNFIALVLFHVLLRTGWIFKAESSVIPAVLDSICGNTWWRGAIRGFLPLLSRGGISMPPLIAAQQVRVLPRKKWGLVIWSSIMGVSFLAIAFVFWINGPTVSLWLPIVFLLFYTLFFIAAGMARLFHNTLQGKLIRPTRRGRLMLISTTLGSVLAIACVVVLLPRWLNADQGQFYHSFAFAGGTFIAAGLTGLLLIEPIDRYRKQAAPLMVPFKTAYIVLRNDANFRLLAMTGALFSSSLMLLPHYQALGRERLGLQMSDLVWWLVLQYIGTAIFSMLAGPLADKKGNRLAMRVMMLGVVFFPLLALVLAHSPRAVGRPLFSLVFFFLGLTPITLGLIYNYTLEISPRKKHPLYLSTLGLCLALPMLLSPLAGWLVSLIGFEPVFIAISTTVFISWLLTFRLPEPRHHIHQPIDATAPTAPEE